METEIRLIKKAAEIRMNLLHMIYKAKTGHTGGSLSSIDILTVLYYHILRINPEDPKNPVRDRFIMSKGHSVEGLYTILANKGFFPREELKAFQVTDMDVQVYCLMGDGEQAEGSVWEAAPAGPNFELDNLTAIIDRNHLQISGNTEVMMNIGTKTLDSVENVVTSIGYALDDKVIYVLEGNIDCTGATIRWLVDDLELISNAKEAGIVAATGAMYMGGLAMGIWQSLKEIEKLRETEKT